MERLADGALGCPHFHFYLGYAPVIQHVPLMAKTHSARGHVQQGLGLRADGTVISANKGLEMVVQTQMAFCVLSKEGTHSCSLPLYPLLNLECSLGLGLHPALTRVPN